MSVYSQFHTGKETPVTEMPNGYLINAYKKMRAFLNHEFLTTTGTVRCRKNAQALICEIRRRKLTLRKSK